MSIATVSIISPILVDGEWVNSGETTLPLDEAQRQESAGMVEIVSVDGSPVSWAACCCHCDHEI